MSAKEVFLSIQKKGKSEEPIAEKHSGLAGQLSVRNVSHSYGAVQVLSDVNLHVAPGEFVTFLGPSGCGKTTLLRIIAGFISQTVGQIVLHGENVSSLPAHRRPLNMVFQRSTLFPHLDVFENVAFGLRIAKTPKAEVSQRVREALALVRLDGFEKRRSFELSGGQVQRVALARALVCRQKVLLLDEPLSALDLAVKLEMEEELRRLRRETGATFVYVTHDQREALALSDRIAVFRNGIIEQLGTPTEIYRHPTSAFVARFVGDANVIPVTVYGTRAGKRSISVGSVMQILPKEMSCASGSANLVLRPEVLQLDGTQKNGIIPIRGTVIDLAYRGMGYTLQVNVPGISRPLKVEVPDQQSLGLRIGENVSITWSWNSAVLIPAR